MIDLRVPDSPKMLRETLCKVFNNTDLFGRDWTEHDTARIQRLIHECDRHRPLGTDGKHGDLHTPTCGCEDK